MSKLRRRTGFTLIEVLIVIVVIAILAAIVVPRLLGAGREAREASLRAHLQEMRNAIGLFQAQCGDYPNALADIMATAAPASGGNGVVINTADWHGPYLTTADGNLPKNPISGANAEGTDWLYTKTTGALKAKAGTAVDTTNYSTW
jgi:general secretion pathway protein G